MKPIQSIDDPRYVKAMSHPLRVRILAMLQQRKASPVEIARMMDTSLGTISYHVRCLLQLGLIELVGETRRRGAVEHHYRALSRLVITDEAWSRATPIAKQAAVGSTLQMIGELASASAAAGGFDRADAALVREALRVDAEGFSALSAACEAFRREVRRIETEASERIGDEPHPEGVVDAAVVHMLFEAASMSQVLASSARGDGAGA
ncbi:MAG: hypothetical protein AVDCRST_MAG30-379 [uncultured Solirubrobacteraceae bacterium]|uniref:HTH arsR-type domain-containing protein n=1 Tax=uncultured Solirubrobacteraceae bacterium TaxID=1162706 RepID=A0A6J4RTG4_9ACTN|nr:MAG: hypothetical protein AVDCRST_MAG30-379 [uncultured Solirubrobacteraceae bacterium]